MPFRCRLWRNILKGWEDFNVNISFKVGNGKRINLWKHTLCGDNLLKIEFQSLFWISCQRDLTIQQIRRTLSSDLLRFRRDFHDWEVTELHRLLAILHRQVISFDNSDALQWGSGLWGIMEFSLLNLSMSNFWLGPVWCNMNTTCAEEGVYFLSFGC